MVTGGGTTLMGWGSWRPWRRVGWQLHPAAPICWSRLPRFTQGWGCDRLPRVAFVGLLAIPKQDLPCRWGRAVPSDLILSSYKDGLPNLRYLQLRNTIASKPHKTDLLRNLPINPLFVRSTLTTLPVMLAEFAARLPKGGEDHATIHAYKNLVRRYRVSKPWWQGVSIGLFRGLHSEVDDRLEKGFHVRGCYVWNPMREQQRNASPGRLVLRRSDITAIHLNMTQKAMSGVRTTVKINDQTIALDLNCRDHDSVPNARRLPLGVEELPVDITIGAGVSICLDSETRAERKSAMREALLRNQHAFKLTTTSLGKPAIRKAYICPLEGIGNPHCRAVLTDGEDLRRTFVRQDPQS